MKLALIRRFAKVQADDAQLDYADQVEEETSDAGEPLKGDLIGDTRQSGIDAEPQTEPVTATPFANGSMTLQQLLDSVQVKEETSDAEKPRIDDLIGDALENGTCAGPQPEPVTESHVASASMSAEELLKFIMN